MSQNQAGYDVSIAGEGLARNPPLDMGYNDDGVWKPINGPYYHEIRCSVRANIVRLPFADSETALNAPSDPANFSPRFDEDCAGVFAHPEIGTIRIPNAGRAIFWVEFNYGKHIYPRLGSKGINLLTEQVTRLAREAFATEFVQACTWG